MSDDLDDFLTCLDLSCARPGGLRRTGDPLPGRPGRSRRRPAIPRRPRRAQELPKGGQEVIQSRFGTLGEALEANTRRKATFLQCFMQCSRSRPERPEGPPGAAQGHPEGPQERSRPEGFKASLDQDVLCKARSAKRLEHQTVLWTTLVSAGASYCEGPV